MATEGGLTIRLSFSNLFKEFKSTSTWLQFPFVVGSGKENPGIVGMKVRGSSSSAVTRAAPESTRWTLLALDLRAILSKYLHAKFAYLKNVKLCANLLVKGVFSSSHEYSPLGGSSDRDAQPLPREMAFPLPKGKEFSELFDYIRFPVVTVTGPQGVTPSLSSGRSLQGVRSDMAEGLGGGEMVGEDVGGERRRRRREEKGAEKSLHVKVSLDLFLVLLFSTHFLIFPLDPFIHSLN